MSTFAKRIWLRTLAYGLPGLGLAGWLVGVGAQAQDAAAGATSKNYLNKTAITLPVLLEDKYRAQLQGIHLYVKEGPTAPWKLHEKAPPTQTSFTYRAAGDGELGFNIVSVDANGRSIPADVAKEPPALVVVIDTQAPRVNIQPLQNGPEGQQVRCETADPHLDAAKTRFSYQAGDQVWRDLTPQAGKTDTYCVPAQAGWTGMVRLVAVDHAGNETKRELNLAAALTAAPPAPAKSPAINPLLGNVLNPKAVVAPAVGPGATPVPSGAETLVTVDPVTLQPQGTGVPIPPLPQNLPGSLPPLPPSSSALPRPPLFTSETSSRLAGGQLFDPAAKTPAPLPNTLYEVKSTALVTREPSPPNRHLAAQARMALDYKVDALGASGVGRVEIWYTRDLGQSWHKLCEDADKQSPADITLPAEGVFGVSMVVSNGRGFGANPPKTGDTPDFWIELDSTRPQADITAIRAADDGALHITWAARDKNLGDDPIELSYAASRQGPWQIIARGLKNDGAYRWTPPAEVGPQAFFRVTVRDQAGNVTNAETSQPVPIDDHSRPRGRVLGISPTAERTPVAPVP